VAAGSRLLNVRLDAAHVRKVHRLRRQGVILSDLVRAAIDERFAQLGAPLRRRDAQAIVADIIERYPDPDDRTRPRYNVHDRHEARRAVLRALKRRR
jgi:hypothetical protein